jgi:hypothetical protein
MVDPTEISLNKTITIDELWQLSDSEDATIRHAVATKRKCPPELLYKLSTDSCPLVRKRVIWNRSTPKWILEKMVNDSLPELAEDVREKLSRDK